MYNRIVVTSLVWPRRWTRARAWSSKVGFLHAIDTSVSKLVTMRESN